LKAPVEDKLDNGGRIRYSMRVISHSSHAYRMSTRFTRAFIGSVLIAAAALAEDGVPYEQRKDVVYGEVHGTGLLMDIFSPRSKPNGLAIVDVVSGAWHSDRNKIRDHTIAQLYTIYCARGYVVFAVRPGSKTRYTAADMDRHVKTAIRYAKEHAAEFKIDPSRLGLTGASAGGHLATLAALTPAPGKTDAKNPLDRHDTTVRAVGVFFPPTDFLEWENGRMADLNVVAPLLFLNGVQGHSQEEIKEAARSVSPFHRVGQPTIPFLLIHGDADKVVPLAHSQKLVAAIKDSGGSAELIIKAGGGHPWPTLPEEIRMMADWFDRQLGEPTAPGTPSK
jgi:acetyl esterase/lipase